MDANLVAHYHDGLKLRFLELRRRRDAMSDPRYTIEELWALRGMAKEGVYPDGRFSDNDCNVWQLFAD